jgi:transposase
MGYSIDFRRKVLEIKDRDRLSFEETASRFGISKSRVSRWAKRLVRDVETHPSDLY